MSPLEITLVILLVTIIAFVSGKVPFSVISTGIILALILTGIKTPAEAFGGFINTNVVMFVAMFVIGAGLTKTPLIDKAQSLVIRYKDNMRMLIFLSCVAGAFLGAITSATATAAIMIPLLVGIANDIGVSPQQAAVSFYGLCQHCHPDDLSRSGCFQHGMERCHDAGRRTDTAAHLGFHHCAHPDADHCHPVHDLCWL